ncbi:MAG: alpha-ketoacid dehydrogenase subunit alpha/beta [Flavobacteriales bacterium]|mgnify:FL=1|tara:strand:- start:14662 stop:17073 length:2412 start_codon:yes stop_codon:yes gene_type:complete
MTKISKEVNPVLSYKDFITEVINDYAIAVTSRECSILGRREVLTGKAKFGIFGDGKEVPQLAMAKCFKNGDFRSGYYRDQTFMMAIGKLTSLEFFAGLYAHTDLDYEPMSAGRQMGGHFTTQSLDDKYEWKDLTAQKNSSSDISPTASQMPRLLGLAQASKIYRHNKEIDSVKFSKNGNEIAWGTIGNASTSEGLFFETINAAGVLQVPMVTSIWDDEYGISVHAKHHTTKENISEILNGFKRTNTKDGYEIIEVKGWDYVNLIKVYEKAEKTCREKHIPIIIHVSDLTQPLGHSTSGSHERYKTSDRLDWEKKFDCNSKMREWIISNNISTNEELIELEKSIQKKVKEDRAKAWKAVISITKNDKEELLNLLNKIDDKLLTEKTISIIDTLKSITEPSKKDIISTARKVLYSLNKVTLNSKRELIDWLKLNIHKNTLDYSSHLYSQSKFSPLKIKEIRPLYNTDSKDVDARVILRNNFDKILKQRKSVIIFGEDSGKIGDVNQGLEGLQDKFGETRVSDTGIREATIIGQGIGLSLRGLRPIAEIQYLDYLLYALQIMSDDLATLHYRTKGRQKAPMIIRTRGHRLEGIWHSGSPLGGILGFLRGIYILTPRNMTKAAGFYNTMLDSDQPALIIECLNAYRVKEKEPYNLSEIRTPVGKIEVVNEGSDLTVVSYGSTLNLIQEVVQELSDFNISIELIDVQTLIPFDLEKEISKSVSKTNKLLIVDEDVPGGGTGYILNELISNQNIYNYLDSEPKILSAKDHRPAYGTDGDYFSKPSKEDVFELVYEIMNESDPHNFPKLL